MTAFYWWLAAICTLAVTVTEIAIARAAASAIDSIIATGVNIRGKR
jgi:hypothetical protein